MESRNRAHAHVALLQSGVFIKALVDEGVVQLGCCAVLKHLGDFGARLLFSGFPA